MQSHSSINWIRTKAMFHRQLRKETPCCVVFVDYQTFACATDLALLAELNGRGVGVVASAANLSALHTRCDAPLADALCASFSTLMLFRNTDPLLDTFAMLHLGAARSLHGDSSESIQSRKPICPLGLLGSLPPNHALVSLHDGTKYQTPLWFALSHSGHGDCM